MKRWEVTLIVRGEKKKHVVKADDYEGAVARASRPYKRGFSVDKVHLLGEVNPK